MLTRLLNLAVRYDWLDKNRLKVVELPDAIRRTRVATTVELERMRLLRDRVTPDVLKELWRVVVAELNTGLRESKLLAVQRSWIREEADGWWLVLPPSQSRLKGTPGRRLMIHCPHLPTAEYSGAGIMSEHLRNTGLASASLRIFRISIFTTCDIHSQPACKASASIMRHDKHCLAIACRA